MTQVNLHEISTWSCHATEALKKKTKTLLCVDCSVPEDLEQPATVQTDGFFQQHCLPAEGAKSGLRSPILHVPNISSRKTAENGENRICGNPSALGKLVFLFSRGSRSSWSKRLVASVDRLYKWKSFREIGGQLFRVIICKFVVCCNIWTGNTLSSNLFA